MATTKITNPDLFDITANTALRLPSGSTDQRPTSPSTGEWRYNTTTNLVEFYDGADWRELQSEDIPPIPSENFNVVLYTGNGSTQSITGVGFKPDFVWIKPRNFVDNHVASDSTRGDNKSLAPNTNATEQTTLGVASFDADGFSLPSWGNVNSNGDTFVAWCWKANGGTTSSNTDGTITTTVQANISAKFSIISYTGTGYVANQSIGHGLGVKPELVILKALDSSQDWQTFGDSLFDRMQLNNDGADDNNFPLTYSSTTVTLPQGGGMEGDPAWNGSGNNYIAYAFASVAGFSKISSYTGNGSTNGPIVNTGFQPAFVMIKSTSTAGNWVMFDDKRSPSNPRNKLLWANKNDAEQTFAYTREVNFYTNGFQPVSSGSDDINDNGQTYIYIAFASDPSAAPTLADSFGILSYTGNSSGSYPTTTSQNITGLPFQPQHAVVKRLDGAGSWPVYDILRGDFEYYYWNSTSATGNSANTTYPGGIGALSDGIQVWDDGAGNYQTNAPGGSYIGYAWKANILPSVNTDGTIQSLVSVNQAAGMSIVKWTSTSSSSDTIGHGLGVKPDVVLYKKFSASGSWFWYTDVIDGSWDELVLNSNSAKSDFAGTYATSTTFKSVTSSAGANWMTYCFASIAGFSKIGTYTGVSSGVTITTGFRPSFIMVKSSSNVENWAVLDTTRGSGKVINPNLSNAQSDSALNTFTVSDTGFSFPDQSIADAMLNENGYQYIYMAFRENPPQPPISSGYMEYLVVAGGGGSSADSGGGAGAGAGGLRTSYGSVSGGGASAETAITLATGTYTITVGAGGAAYDGATTSQNGVASTITGTASVSTVGGGAAGDFLKSGTAYKGNDGGSGGGSANSNGALTLAGGAGTANEGFAGGAGSTAGGPGSDSLAAGGGGGAAQVGTDGALSTGGNGGNGLNIAITGSYVGYAGGGGGGCRGTSGTTAGQGGTGGGGNAVSSGVGNAGTANTGGGGGGGRSAGANGGSGVVILRMNTSDYSGSTTGSPTVTTEGSETILTYTGSGTYVHS